MNKIKIFIIIVLSLSVIPSFAFAQTFRDVNPDDWFYDYVEQVVDDGIVDKAVNFRPNDALKRAEFIKMIMIASDGMKDYEAPVIPTFDDAPAGAWYYDYIEAAIQMGIIDSYTNANGFLTGYVGPGDTLNRAAATKILINAFSIQSNLKPASKFPDVKEGDWFYDYVVTAYNTKILNGYADGTFGPNKAINRAEATKLIMKAMYPDYKPIGDQMEEQIVEPVEEPVVEEPETGIPAVPNDLTIEESNLPAETGQVYLARYDFSALYEDVIVDTLTLVNDITGDYLGDNAVSTTAVKEITVKYPDENGFLQTKTAPLGPDGKLRLSNLSFYVLKNENTFFEIYADLNSVKEIGESLSGEVIRIGLQNINNNEQSFKAIGATSSETLVLGSRVNISNSNLPQSFTIRKTLPVFDVINDEKSLTSGDNNIIKFTITANESGPLTMARIVINMYVNDSSGGNLEFSDFKLFRGNSLITDKVNIYDATGGADIKSGGGNIMSGTSNIIISFNEAENISAGKTETYRLQATAMNVENNDYIITKINSDDEDTPLSGLTTNTNENTGRIYKNGDATEGIFTNSTDFSQVLGANRSIIWSDKSSDYYAYPEVSNGSVTDGSGSYDWTNGYLIDIYGLPDSMLSN